MKKFDVVLIGSGISSLTCALFLAKAGKSVCVLEQHAKPGGFMHCFSRFGHQFDTGAHYAGGMGERQPFRVLLDYLGIYDESIYVPLSATDFDVFRFPSLQFGFSGSYAETVASLHQLFPSEREAVTRYFSTVQSVAKRFPTYNFSEHYDPLSLDEALTVPLSDFVESLTRNINLQNVFYAYCSLHGVAPRDIALGFHAIITDSLLNGAVGFKSGGDSLARKYVEAIEGHGGEIRTKTRVTGLVVQNKEIRGIRTENGEAFAADTVISGIHPKSLFRMIDSDNFSPAFTSRIESLKETAGFFGIYAKCSRDIPFDRRKNYFFFSDDDFHAAFDRRNRKEPGFAFICRPDREEGRAKPSHPLTLHAPSPMEWFEAWKGEPYGKRSVGYGAFKEEVAQGIFSLVERYHPDLKSRIDAYAVSTPLTTLHFNGSEGGSSYGIYHSIDQTGPRALGPRTHIGNLLLTGQNCLLPGLLASAISGMRTAGHLLGIKPILKELRLKGEGA